MSSIMHVEKGVSAHKWSPNSNFPEAIIEEKMLSVQDVVFLTHK